jgi:hypothetical protein
VITARIALDLPRRDQQKRRFLAEFDTSSAGAQVAKSP